MSMRFRFRPLPIPTRPLVALVALALVGAPVARAADKPDVIAVVAADGYADLRDQLSWIGEQVGNPTLAGFAESFLLLATQGKGLAGLDVKRPIGIVVMSEGGPLPTVHGYVPVKDLGKLLNSVQSMTGPVEDRDGVRRIALPAGMAIEIVDKDGWAIVSQEGAGSGPADPLSLIEPVSKEYSIGVQLFPSKMPADMRERLKGLLEEAGRNAAAQGQPMDAGALAAAIENLQDVEKLAIGLAVDKEKDLLAIDITAVMVAGSAGADVWTGAGKAASTVGSPTTADGKPAAVRAHYAQAVPEAARAAIEAGLAQAIPADSDDPLAGVLGGLVRDITGAMLETGAVDAGLTLDVSAADAKAPLPAVTIGMKIKDGAALEKKVKERLSKKDALPPGVTVKFDAGKQGDARLHEVSVGLEGNPLAERIGDKVTLTLAVAPSYAYLLVGGDVPKRLAAALAAGGKPIATAAPLTGIDVSLASLVAYAAKMAEVFQPGDPQGEMLSDVAKQAATKKTTLVQFSVKPVPRGVTLRLSADAGAIQTIAAGAMNGAGGPPPGPRPMVRPRPRLEKAPAGDAPALAP
jgi:hypothetical protein